MPVIGRALRKGISVVATERQRVLWRNGIATAAGKKVAPGNAMIAAAVYSAVRVNVQTVAQLPIDFLEVSDATRTPVFPERVRPLWARPNPDQSRIAFMETVGLSLQLWGNFYGYVRWTNGGDAYEIWPVDPDLVSDIARLDEQGNVIGDERLRSYRGRLGTAFKVEGFGWVRNVPGKNPEMLHIPWMTLPGQIKGLSPVEWHAEQIGMSLGAEEHAARFLGDDSAALSGTLDVPGDLTEDEAEALWNNFQRRHGGNGRAGRVGVLTGGAKFSAISIPPNQLQFLEQMQYADRKIASIYGVPPHMVGDVEPSTSWGTGIEEQRIGHTVFTVIPIVQRIEQAVEDQLLTELGIQMRMQVNGLLRGSVRDRGEFYRVMWSIGWMNADEGRGLEDMPPIPNGLGQRYYVPLNVAPVDADPADLEQRFRLAAAAGAFGQPAIPPVAAGGDA